MTPRPIPDGPGGPEVTIGPASDPAARAHADRSLAYAKEVIASGRTFILIHATDDEAQIASLTYAPDISVQQMVAFMLAAGPALRHQQESMFRGLADA